jgi:hypothetical protein
MKTNPCLEQVYELLEQFDFKELSDEDRICVLSELSEKEYTILRDTLKTTESFYSNSGEPNINDSLLNSLINTNHKQNIILNILNQPVKLYQLAASIILILALYTLKQYSDLPDKNSALPKNDTVHSKLADTVRIIKEKILYMSVEKATDIHDKLLSTATYDFDISNVIYPNHNDSIQELTLNDIDSNNTLFKN